MSHLLSLIQLYESSVHDSDVSSHDLVEFVERESIEDIFKGFSREEKQQFVAIIHDQILYIVERNYITVEFENEDEIKDEQVRNRVVNDLGALEAITKLCIAHSKTVGKMDETFYNCVCMLGGVLHAVTYSGTIGQSIQSHIASLLESTWTRYLDTTQSEEISRRCSINQTIEAFSYTATPYIPHMMSYYLDKAIDEDAKPAAVKKCLQLKETLLELEPHHFEKELLDSSSVKLQDFLAKTFISPHFLYSSNGQKFLVFVFSQILPELSIKLHRIILDQIYMAEDDALEVYANIYFKAWKAATGEIKLIIENECLQNLMEIAILSRDKKLFVNIRTLLQYAFHTETKKKNDNVDEMLLRLYEPILFRNLCVANATVRRQASCLLIDIFPLRNPTADRCEAEQLLNQQLTALREIMEDDVPAVRCVGIQGVCQILKAYWDAVPSEDRHNLMKLVVHKYSLDASSVPVRLSVIKGVNTLLENPLSHALAKQLLCGGQFGKLIHDSAIAIRKEFITLLLHLKTIQSISYLDIVSENDIVRRLCVDEASVRDQITQLLLNSYFAYDKSAAEQFVRLKSFISSNSYGARLFYQCAVKYVPPSAGCDFLRIIVKFLEKCCSVTKRMTENGQSEDQEDQENQENIVENQNKSKNTRSSKRRKVSEKERQAPEKGEKSVALLCKDLPFMESIIEIAATLVEQINIEYADDEDNIVTSFFSSAFLMNLKTYFKTNRIQSAIWKICKFLPEEKIAQFSRNCISSLEIMCEEGMIRSDMPSILECIMQWKQSTSLLKFIEEKLNVDREVIKPVSQSNKTRQKRRRVNAPIASSQEVYTQSFIALHFLNTLLQNDTTRKTLFKEGKKKKYPLIGIYNLLSKQISEKLPSILTSNNLDRIQEQYFIAAFHTWGKISLHLSAPERTLHDVNENVSKQAKLYSKMYVDAPPDSIKAFISLCNDSILPAVEVACENENAIVEQFINQERRGKKRRNNGDEIETSSEKNPYFHLSICICRSICMILGDSILLGLLRPSQPQSIDNITGIIYGFLRENMTKILSYTFGDILKILYSLVNKGWDHEVIIGLFKEIIISSSIEFVRLSDSTSSIQMEQIKHSVRMKKQYLQKLLRAFSSKNLDHHIAFYLFNSCMKELKENQNESEGRLFTKEDSQLPALSKLVTDLISESETIQREILKRISIALQSSQDQDQMTSEEKKEKHMTTFSALQFLSLLVRLSSSQEMFKNEQMYVDVLEYLAETETNLAGETFEGVDILHEIDTLRQNLQSLHETWDTLHKNQDERPDEGITA